MERTEILQSLQTSSKRDGHYSSFQDGEYFKENKLLTEELGIALGLYIDDFEVCNPLGKETQSVWHLLGDIQLTNKI